MTKKIKGFGKTSIAPKTFLPPSKSKKTPSPKKQEDPVTKDGKANELSNKNIMANLGDAPYVVFALDSTGSMNSCIQECRDNLRDLIQQLLKDNPRTRVGFVMFGDYCDGQNCIRIKDFSDNADEIVEFVRNCPNTSGGDTPECYELVLNRVAQMGWTEQGGALVLVGDANPHPTQDSDPQNNPEHIDWRKELENLAAKKVKVFPCQCLYRSHQADYNEFWAEVADTCKTPLLKMEFGDSSHTLAGIAYATTGGSDGLRRYAASASYMAKSATSETIGCSFNALMDYTSTLEKKDEDDKV